MPQRQALCGIIDFYKKILYNIYIKKGNDDYDKRKALQASRALESLDGFEDFADEVLRLIETYRDLCNMDDTRDRMTALLNEEHFGGVGASAQIPSTSLPRERNLEGG